MKYAIPAAALLLGGAAWMTRAKEAEAPRRPLPPRKVEPSRDPAPAVVVEATAEVKEERAATRRPAVEATPARASSAEKPRADARLEARLRGLLLLSDEQKIRVSQILEERSSALAAYEAEVRRRGWSRLEEFSHRVQGIRALSYDRIAALLDAEQAALFAELRPTLHESDFISIATPETEVVSLD